MARNNLGQSHFMLAGFIAIWTTGGKAASRRRIDWACHLSLYIVALLISSLKVWYGYSVQQRLRIRVQRMSKLFLCWRQLDQLAKIHYSNFTAYMLNNAQVMSNKHICKISAVLKIHHKIQYLCLY